MDSVDREWAFGRLVGIGAILGGVALGVLADDLMDGIFLAVLGIGSFLNPTLFWGLEEEQKVWVIWARALCLIAGVALLIRWLL